MVTDAYAHHHFHIRMYACARACVRVCVCVRARPPQGLVNHSSPVSIHPYVVNFCVILFNVVRAVEAYPLVTDAVPLKPTCLFSTPPRGCSLGQGKPSIWMAPLSTAACHPPLGRQGTVTFPR